MKFNLIIILLFFCSSSLFSQNSIVKKQTSIGMVIYSNDTETVGMPCVWQTIPKIRETPCKYFYSAKVSNWIAW